MSVLWIHGDVMYVGDVCSVSRLSGAVSADSINGVCCGVSIVGDVTSCRTGYYIAVLSPSTRMTVGNRGSGCSFA